MVTGRKREQTRAAGAGAAACLTNIENCKRLKQETDYLDANDQVRSNDGATTSKLLDGNVSLGSGDGSKDLQERLAEDDQVQDTVGVVVLDRSGQVASTVSSGGIALKQPGRVGQASCFGCGCWAQRPVQEAVNSTAVSTTGECEPGSGPE